MDHVTWLHDSKIVQIVGAYHVRRVPKRRPAQVLWMLLQRWLPAVPLVSYWIEAESEGQKLAHLANQVIPEVTITHGYRWDG